MGFNSGFKGLKDYTKVKVRMRGKPKASRMQKTHN